MTKTKELLQNEEYIEPETVRQLLGEDVDRRTILKQMAYKIIKNTDAPFVDFYVFENIVHILNEVEPDVDKTEGTAPHQIWLALEKLKEILGDDLGLSPEVKTYIRAIYKENGLIFLPRVFDKEENPNLKKILERVKQGNLQESDHDILENQAIELAKILHYVEHFKEEF